MNSDKWSSTYQSDTAKICCEQKKAELAEFTIQSRLSRMVKFPDYALISTEYSRKFSCSHKMKKHATGKFDVHWNKTFKKSKKDLNKKIQKSSWFDNFWRAFFFEKFFWRALKKNIFNEFWRKFQEAEGSRFHSGRQQKIGLRAADFRRVCYQCMQWIRFLRVSRHCTQLKNLEYLPRSWLLVESS